MNPTLHQLLADTLGLAPSAIDENTTMANTPLWDSVMHLNLCLSIESEFGLSLTPEEMIALNSVAAIEALLAERGVT